MTIAVPKVLRLSTSQPDFEQQFAARLHLDAQQSDAIEQRVREIVDDVRARRCGAAGIERAF